MNSITLIVAILYNNVTFDAKYSYGIGKGSN